ATQEPEQHGFRLVRARMTGGDAIELVSPQKVHVELTTRVASRLFQIVALARDIPRADVRRQTQTLREDAYESGVAARLFAAQPVVEVQHRQLQIPMRVKLDQRVQQEHGIRAARYRYADPITRPEHAITDDGF